MRTTSKALTTALAVTPLLVAASVATASAAPAAHPNATARPSHPSPTVAPAVRRQVAENGGASVLVALRGRAATAHPDSRRGARAHAKALEQSQAPVLSALKTAGRATHVHAYSTFDVISAHVTKAGLAALEARSDVAVVAPNAVLRLDPTTSRQRETGTAPPSASVPTTGTPTAVPAGVCSTAKAQVPEALQTTRTQSDDPNAKTARSLGATGSGVSVAFMAEGIDVNNPEFVRSDGSPVFTDYQDFSSEGTSAPTSGGEAFLDATSIAAQGTKTYDVSRNTFSPTKGACKIRVIGVAPGASMVALKVFGNNTASTTGFLEAIDYAVDTDHVDVLNQSFGSNPVPDTTMDVIRAADEAAVAAGTTITVSSGDSGVTNTIGSPATSPGVIAVGASTTYRPNLQAGYDGGHLPGIKGYLSNNISSISSSGTDQDGGTVDLVAPGDSSWVACTPDPAQYADCQGYHGGADVELSGGTSESAPLTAGGAALVIQAYRQTHHNTSPTPAQVKQILISSARDINAPADQQGAGELNTYRAVQLARSIPGSGVTPTPQAGNTFVTDTSQLDVVGATRTPVTHSVTVTNTGQTTQVITPSTRALGAYSAFAQLKVVLSKSSPTFHGSGGYQDPYEKVTFTVPAGASRLDASLAYQSATSDGISPGEMVLIGPNGSYAANTLPQGVGNYGDTQVTKPTAGRWTAYVYTAPAALGGILGTYLVGFRTAKFTSGGTVGRPLTLAPGKSGTVTYSSTTPSTPGDAASSIVLSGSPGGNVTTIPVVLRSLVPVSTSTSPSFHGNLTGGNGRNGGPSQAAHHQFDVASGTAQLNASVSLAHDPDNPFFLSLIDPNGDQVGYGSNVFLSSLSGKPTLELSGVTHVLKPAAGRWTLVVTFAPFVSGAQLQQSFSGEIDTAGPKVVPTGLPTTTGTTLPAGKPTVAYVAVTNTTSEPEAYFADARTNKDASYTLAGSTARFTLPGADDPQWLVPSETGSITATMTSSAPSAFDLYNGAGDPDIESDSGTTPSVTYSAPTVAPGVWAITPALIGPFGAVASQHATASATMSATTRGFDRGVTSSTHDLWLSSVDENASGVKPVVVQPGKTGIITVTITPQGTSGSTVAGTLYVDTLASFTPSGVSPNANEVAALPYTYTIG